MSTTSLTLTSTYGVRPASALGCAIVIRLSSLHRRKGGSTVVPCTPSLTSSYYAYVQARMDARDVSRRAIVIDRSRPASGGNGVVIILYPGDLLKALGQKIRTSIRHADPQTVKEWHRDEAIRVLKFLREAVLAELRRDGRKWEWAKPSEEEVHERLADCDHPLRDKVPNAVRDGDARFGLLAMSALLWAVRRMDLLTGGLRRSVTSMDKVYVSELKKLRTDMVAWIKKLVARKRAGQVGVAADACDDDGEKVHSAFQAVGVARTVADARRKAGRRRRRG
ncbi:unnamed protein product [Closterium sp. NIES-64]|nr:unnamed protein product [Closterium sp. NIES-64]